MERQYLDCAAEGSCLVCNSLTDGGIHDEYNVVRADCIDHLLHLIEKCVLLPVATGSVDNDQLGFRID